MPRLFSQRLGPKNNNPWSNKRMQLTSAVKTLSTRVIKDLPLQLTRKTLGPQLQANGEG